MDNVAAASRYLAAGIIAALVLGWYMESLSKIDTFTTAVAFLLLAALHAIFGVLDTTNPDRNTDHHFWPELMLTILYIAEFFILILVLKHFNDPKFAADEKIRRMYDLMLVFFWAEAAYQWFAIIVAKAPSKRQGIWQFIPMLNPVSTPKVSDHKAKRMFFLLFAMILFGLYAFGLYAADQAPAGLESTTLLWFHVAATAAYTLQWRVHFFSKLQIQKPTAI